jgi:hypothetical protein
MRSFVVRVDPWLGASTFEIFTNCYIRHGHDDAPENWVRRLVYEANAYGVPLHFIVH